MRRLSWDSSTSLRAERTENRSVYGSLGNNMNIKYCLSNLMVIYEILFKKMCILKS